MADDSPTLADAAHAYAAAGLSLIPTKPRDKAPVVTWGHYQTARVEPDELENWLASYPRAGLGIIGGAISGNLAILDVDDDEFSQWLETHAAPLLQCSWTVRTGSGRIHLYLRSESPTRTTKISRGRKLADVRGEGAYAVAPPSIHPNGTAYTTLYGGPDRINTVADAMEFFEQIADAYAPGVSRNSTRPVDTGPTKVRPLDDPALVAEYQVRIKALDINAKYRKAILEGATPGEGEWLSTQSYSDLDFTIICELVRVGLTDDEIEIIYANFPIGTACYQNISRNGSHGSQYLDLTLGKVKERLNQSTSAEADASGENFRILRVTRIEYEEPVYELEIENDLGALRAALFSNDQIWSELQFKRRLSTVMHAAPRLRPGHRGRVNFGDFVDILIRMAESEAVPLGATKSGSLKGFIVELLNQEGRLLEKAPEDRYAVSLGWKNGVNVYVRGSIITRHTSAMRPPPSPEQIWAVLRNMGGDEVDVEYGSAADPAKERLWILPKRSLVG